jgi:hypothetical protein
MLIQWEVRPTSHFPPGSYIIQNFLPANYSACHLLSRWYLVRHIRLWRFEYVPLKRRLTFNKLHGVISQRIVFFMFYVALKLKLWSKLWGWWKHTFHSSIMKDHKKPWTWTDFLNKRPKRKKMDMIFGTWNVRSLYRAGSLRTVAEEISKYKLDLVGVQEVRWGRGGSEHIWIYIFLWKGEWKTWIRYRFFVHKRILSTVKRVEFISDRMS